MESDIFWHVTPSSLGSVHHSEVSTAVIYEEFGRCSQTGFGATYYVCLQGGRTIHVRNYQNNEKGDKEVKLLSGLLWVVPCKILQILIWV
jgi:hypothetical protein